MKKNMYKTIFVLMSLLMVINCGKKDGKATEGSGGNNGPSFEIKPLEYPLATDGSVKFKYWASIISGALPFLSNYSQHPAYQEIQKLAGVSLEFIHPTPGQEVNQFNLMVASGDLPDLMQNAHNYPGGILKGYEDGVFVDLTPYLEECAPDYYQYINSNEIAKKQVYKEGKVLAFYKMTFANAIPYLRPIVHADWLDEFGFDTPETFDDWEKYFQAILEKKPGVTPMYINFNSGEIQNLWTGAFDIISGFFVVDGKILHISSAPRYKEFLAKMNEWYEKGYLRKDVSLTDQQVYALFDAGKLGGYCQSVDTTFTRILSNPAVIPESTPNPRLFSGQKLHSGIPNWPVDTAIPMDTAISTQCKDIENAIKFLNFGYTKEGAFAYNYGIEGLTYTVENGVPEYTDFMLKNTEKSIQELNNTYRVHFAPKYCEPDINAHLGIVASPGAAEFRLKWSDDPDIDDSYRLLTDAMPPDLLEEFSGIMVDINAYIGEMKMKFIVGAEPLSNYDAYIKRLDSLKLPRAIEIQQQVYDSMWK
jgi:putative aldouronate transport system substrate-binding protein